MHGIRVWKQPRLSKWEQKMKPDDNKTFWLTSHCRPGTPDENEICGFCGETYGDCAGRCTESVKNGRSIECGGSGYWCPECGRFWAQDVCGESYNGDLQCQDGTEQIVKDSHVFCSCLNKLHMVLAGL